MTGAYVCVGVWGEGAPTDCFLTCLSVDCLVILPPSSLLPPSCTDKRVKVSLFLQEGIQSSSGRLILPSPTSAKVGTVTRYVAATGAVQSQDKVKLKSQQVSEGKGEGEGAMQSQDRVS